jgi:hypothetical protein
VALSYRGKRSEVMRAPAAAPLALAGVDAGPGRAILQKKPMPAGKRRSHFG